MSKNKFNFEKLFGNNNSIVIRIEELLAGKPFGEMYAMRRKLINFYNAEFFSRIGKYKKELSSMPAKEHDEEYKQYLKMLELIDRVEVLEGEDLEMLAKFCIESVNSVENNMSRLSVVPNYDLSIQDYEYSDFENDDSDEDYDSNDDKIFKMYMKKYMILPKREKLERDIKFYEEQIKQNQTYLNEIICFAIDRDTLFENTESVRKILKSIRERTDKKIEIVIDHDRIMTKSEHTVPYSYNEGQLSILENLKHEGLADDLYFSEFHKEGHYHVSRDQIFSFEDVYLANLEKNDFVRKQKELKLSPFEFILSSHFYLNKLDYEEEKSLNPEKCRTFLTFDTDFDYNDRGFVCSAFSSFGKAIVDDYADKNLKCDFCTLNFYDEETKQSKSTHSALLVYIKDEKYGLDGFYIWDPTSDNYYLSLTHCLYPISDLQHYKGRIVHSTDENKFSDYTNLIFSCSPDNLTDENYENFIVENYKDKSIPISLKTYKEALLCFMEKLEKSGGENLEEFWEYEYNSKQEFLEVCLNDSICNLGIFDASLAQNSFYKKMRDFYTSDTSGKYKEWKEKWENCNATYLKNETLEW